MRIPFAIDSLEDASQDLDALARDLCATLPLRSDTIEDRHYDALDAIVAKYAYSASNFRKQVNDIRRPRGMMGRLGDLYYRRMAKSSLAIAHDLFDQIGARLPFDDIVRSYLEGIEDQDVRARLTCAFVSSIARYARETRVLSKAQLPEFFDRQLAGARSRVRGGLAAGLCALVLAGGLGMSFVGAPAFRLYRQRSEARFKESLDWRQVEAHERRYQSTLKTMIQETDDFYRTWWPPLDDVRLILACQTESALPSETPAIMLTKHACFQHIGGVPAALKTKEDLVRATMLARSVERALRSVRIQEALLNEEYARREEMVEAFEESRFRIPSLVADLNERELTHQSTGIKLKKELIDKLHPFTFYALLLTSRYKDMYDVNLPSPTGEGLLPDYGTQDRMFDFHFPTHPMTSVAQLELKKRLADIMDLYDTQMRIGTIPLEPLFEKNGELEDDLDYFLLQGDLLKWSK